MREPDPKVKHMVEQAFQREVMRTGSVQITQGEPGSRSATKKRQPTKAEKKRRRKASRR